MIDRSFVEAIREEVGPAVVAVGGKERVMTHKTWQDVTPGLPQVAPLYFNTLSGLRDYLVGPDAGVLANTALHVVSPVNVRLVGPLGAEAEEYRRPCYAQAAYDPPAYPWDQYQDAEMFNVRLLTHFGGKGARDAIRELIASIKDTAVLETVDDGVAQEVNTRRGVTMAKAAVPNPVLLAPYRTFREVEQPESLFVLRLKPQDNERPKVALFDADGGAWKLEAIANIAAWLRKETKVPVLA